MLPTPTGPLTTDLLSQDQMAKLDIPRLPGEDEVAFQRRYTAEKMRRLRAKWKAEPPSARDPDAPKLNIARLPGESDVDFKRRYCREKMRIYRARKPREPRKPRPKNSKRRADATFTNAEWELLRQRPGESDDEFRRRSNRERMALWRAKNRERDRATARRHYERHPDTERARRFRYRAENIDKVKAKQKEYFEANREARLAKLKAWREANPERYAEVRQRWYDENQALRNAYSAAWRRACREQTPPWADFDQIKAFYEEALRLTLETGIPHHVDHIIPLRGRHVRGLHVQTNLRVIPATENVRKHNQFIEELLAA